VDAVGLQLCVELMLHFVDERWDVGPLTVSRLPSVSDGPPQHH
jgi:hypothetical protein